MSNVKAYLEDIVRDGLHDIAEALKSSGPSGDVQASHVIYDNTESGLTSNRVQGAIDELSTKVDTNASGISDLTTRMGTAEGDITSLDGRLDTAEGDITALETWKDNLDASDIPYDSKTVKDALDSSTPKTDIATVESGSTASKNYSVGELVYVNGNLYKVITAIASGATFTVGTNIQSTNVSGTVKDALDGAKWTYLGQTTGNAKITIPDGVSEVYGRSILSSTSTSFHFLTIEGDIAVDRGSGYYVSSTNCAAASYRWTNATRKANLNGLNFAGTDYTSTATTKWYVKS